MRRQQLLEARRRRSRTWKCTAVRVAVIPVVYVVGPRRGRHRALQPHRMVSRCARRAARKAGRGAPTWHARKLDVGRAGADTALSGIRHPSLGDRRGLRRVQSSESGHDLGRFRAHRQPRRGVRVAAGIRHASTTATWPPSACGTRSSPNGAGFRPRQGSAPAYQYIDDKVPPKPLQTSNQMAYVSLGARGFITRRFMWRADWRKYVVFTNQNQNEEPEEWKFGLAVFF